MTRQDELNEAWCKYRGKCSTEILHALAFALRWCDLQPSNRSNSGYKTIKVTNIACGFYEPKVKGGEE